MFIQNRYINRSIFSECFGGIARLSQTVKDLRAKNENSIFVNGGDFYQVNIDFSFIFKNEWMLEIDRTNCYQLKNLTTFNLTSRLNFTQINSGTFWSIKYYHI
jgi:hypothetical protein